MATYVVSSESRQQILESRHNLTMLATSLMLKSKERQVEFDVASRINNQIQLQMQSIQSANPANPTNYHNHATRSYAQVATPRFIPQTEEFPVIATVPGVSDSQQAKNIITNQLKPADFQNDFTRIVKGKNGRVIFNTSNRESQRKVQSILQSQRFEAREPVRNYPQVLVTGVPSDLEMNDFITKLIS